MYAGCGPEGVMFGNHAISRACNLLPISVVNFKTYTSEVIHLAKILSFFFLFSVDPIQISVGIGMDCPQKNEGRNWIM